MSSQLGSWCARVDTVLWEGNKSHNNITILNRYQEYTMGLSAVKWRYEEVNELFELSQTCLNKLENIGFTLLSEKLEKENHPSLHSFSLLPQGPRERNSIIIATHKESPQGSCYGNHECVLRYPNWELKEACSSRLWTGAVCDMLRNKSNNPPLFWLGY